MIIWFYTQKKQPKSNKKAYFLTWLPQRNTIKRKSDFKLLLKDKRFEEVVVGVFGGNVAHVFICGLLVVCGGSDAGVGRRGRVCPGRCLLKARVFRAPVIAVSGSSTTFVQPLTNTLAFTRKKETSQSCLTRSNTIS